MRIGTADRIRVTNTAATGMMILAHPGKGLRLTIRNLSILHPAHPQADLLPGRLFHGDLAHDLSLIQHGNPVAQVEYLVQVFGDKEDARPPFPFLQKNWIGYFSLMLTSTIPAIYPASVKKVSAEKYIALWPPMIFARSY